MTEKMNEEIMDVAVVEEGKEATLFQEQKGLFYSSIVNNGDRESAVKIFNAINDSEESLSDHLGEVIEVQDIVAHEIQLDDENTGEQVKAVRVVLVTPDGVGYHSVSQGVVSGLQKLFAIVGQAPYSPAVKVVPVEKKTRKGFKTLTLRLHV